MVVLVDALDFDTLSVNRALPICLIRVPGRPDSLPPFTVRGKIFGYF